VSNVVGIRELVRRLSLCASYRSNHLTQVVRVGESGNRGNGFLLPLAFGTTISTGTGAGTGATRRVDTAPSAGCWRRTPSVQVFHIGGLIGALGE
jgi:hypothetical protein